MIFLEPVRDGLLDMWAYKGRTVLQTLGITLGSASVIVTIALMMGGREENKEFLETSGGVTTLEVRKAEGGRQRLFARDQGAWGLTMEDVKAVRAAVEPLGAKVYGARSFRAEVEGIDVETATIWGVTPEYAEIEHLWIDKGRYVSAPDIDLANPVIVLGSRLATTLYGNDENVLGRYVTMRPAGFRGATDAQRAAMRGRPPRRYQVVGILEEKVYRREGSDSDENWLDWMNDLAYIPMTTALAREIGGRDLGFLNVRAVDIEAVESTKMALDHAMLRSHHGVRNYTIFDRAERLQQWNEQGIMYDAAIGGAGAISLLVGGIVIMNILLSSLTQRIREVGIRKALGARNLEIFIQFLTESVIVAAMGGITGAALGSSLSGVVSTMIEQKMMLTPGTMLLGVAVSMTVGLIFGVYPAIKAARLDPVVALRYE